MNNPGMDFEIWKQLRKKWSELDAQGHRLKIHFQLITHPRKKNHVLAIDVLQDIDGKPVTETVQQTAGEAYAVLGIAGLSRERLEEILTGMLEQLASRSKMQDVCVSLTLMPTSPTSGEVRGLLALPDAPVQSPVQVNYQHYYVLNALRDKMLETPGKSWRRVRAEYYAGKLEFYFEYR